MPIEGPLSTLIYDVPAAAFAAIVVLTLALPIVHLALAFGRGLMGGESRIDWWVVGRVLPLAAGLAIALPLTMMARNWTSDEQIAAGETIAMLLVIAAIILPIALPIIQAYVQGLPRIGTFLYSLLAFLALPVAAALATQAVFYVTHQIESSTGFSSGTLPDVFIQDTVLSPCKQDIANVLPEGFDGQFDPVTGDRGYPAFFLFWVEMTLKATFLDFFEVFDCGVTNLRNNPANVTISSFVFLYRAFVSLIVLATVALPFARSRY